MSLLRGIICGGSSADDPAEQGAGDRNNVVMPAQVYYGSQAENEEGILA